MGLFILYRSNDEKRAKVYVAKIITRNVTAFVQKKKDSDEKEIHSELLTYFNLRQVA